LLAAKHVISSTRLYLDDPRADFLLGLGTQILWKERVQPQFTREASGYADLLATRQEGIEKEQSLSGVLEYRIRHLYPCERSSP
jgi:hypothetical protein